MEQSEAPQPKNKPSLLIGSIWVAVVCVVVLVYNGARPDMGASMSYSIGQAMGGALVIWVIFHFLIARRRGWEFSAAALGFILAAAGGGAAVNFKAKENREQMARMGASMKMEMEAIASAVKEAKPTAKIDTTVATRSWLPATFASPASSVTPMSPSAPGTRSQKPGRNDAYCGIAEGNRETQYATGVITSAPTNALTNPPNSALPTT